MIRIYLDWAVYSRLESNTVTYRKLTNILSNNSKYILPYSHAHILDIYKSYLKKGEDGISSHLDKIQKYSKSLFVTNKSDKIQFLNLDSKGAMNQYLDANKNIDTINFDDVLESFKSILPIMNLQVPNPFSNDKKLYDESLKKYPNTLEQSEKLLGNEKTISVIDFFENLINLSKTILSDDSYISARTAYQKDLKVNTGRLNDKRFDSVEVLNEFAIKNGYESFLHYFDKFLGNEQNISFFTKVIKLCNFLDFEGVGVETVKIGHHLDNIISDYSHVAFASTCDIFVIDDKKTREKAKIVFELFNINIKIFNVSDFITYIETNEVTVDQASLLINYLFWVPNGNPDIEEGDLEITFLNSYVLDYFNVIVKPKGNPKHIFLRKNISSHSIGVLKQEFSVLLGKLKQLFQEPIMEKDEMIVEGFYFISWLTSDLVLIKFYLEDNSMLLEVIQCYKTK